MNEFDLRITLRCRPERGDKESLRIQTDHKFFTQQELCFTLPIEVKTTRENDRALGDVPLTTTTIVKMRPGIGSSNLFYLFSIRNSHQYPSSSWPPRQSTQSDRAPEWKISIITLLK